MTEHGLRRLWGWGGKLERTPPTVNDARGRTTAPRAALVVVLASLVAVGCAVTFRAVPREGVHEVHEYLGSSARAPDAEDTVARDPASIWTAEAGRGTLGLPAVGDRIITIATVDRWVYAIDARSGQLFWRFRSDNAFTTGPVMGDGRVFAATDAADGVVAAINLHTGKRIWQTPVGDVSAPLALVDTVLYGATLRRSTVFALSAATGHVVWTRTIGASRSGPLVVGSRVLVATLTDTLFVLDRGTGAITSRIPLGTTTLAPLALLSDSTVVLGSEAGRIMAVRLSTGRVLWRVETGDPVPGAPAVVGDTVFALTNRCTLWRVPADRPAAADTLVIRADSATRRCVTATGPLMLRGGVLVATVHGQVILFDRATRAHVWVKRLDVELRQPPVVRNRQIVVAPTLGNVVSFR